MKIFGSITELVNVIFRKNGQALTLQPSQATTYTASRSFTMPPGDQSTILVGETNTEALSNKTLDGSLNTFSNISLTAAVTGILPTANGGTGQNSSATFPASGNITTDANTQIFTNKSYDADGTGNVLTNIDDGNIKAAAAIDASKIADGSVSSAEFQFINSLTSNAQTQINGKVAKAGDTMTGDLIMDNQHAVKFRETTGSGTNFAAIQAPASLAADYTLTLPIDDGTSGQVLSTDGSGVLSWIAAGSVSGARQDFSGLKRFNDGEIDVADVDVITADTTLTDANKRTQDVNGGATINITLPTTSIKKGEIWTFYNSNVNPVYLYASDSSVLNSTSNGSVSSGKIEQRGKIVVTPLIDTPVTNSDWRVLEVLEEGLFTPTLSGDFATTSDLRYMRINNLVSFNCVFTTNSLAGASATNGNFTVPHATTWVADEISGTGHTTSSTDVKSFESKVNNVQRAAANTVQVTYYNADGTASSFTIRLVGYYKLTGY